MLTIYVADTDALQNEALFDEQYRAVSAARRTKIDHLRFTKDKRLSLGAELLLNQALRDHGVDPHQAQIAYGAQQKPYLASHPTLHFNLSHAGARVMCALADVEVGCDVEIIRPIDLALAKQFFVPSEYATIASQPTDDARNACFYRFWTLKESFMKATGLGFDLALDKFCIQLTQTSVTVEQSVEAGPWSFCELALEPNYHYACCLHAQSAAPHLVRARFER